MNSIVHAFRRPLGCALLGLTAALAAPVVHAQATLQILNNFASSTANAADYFGTNYSNDEVWLYFVSTGGAVSYTNTSGSQTIVSDNFSFKLSEVQNGLFTLSTGGVGTKVFAGLGSTNPFTSAGGPQTFQTNVPYAVAEWTIQGNVYDNVDVSYEDSFALPTKLTVKNSAGTQTAQCSFAPGTQAAAVIAALAAKMPTSPTGPAGANYPTIGSMGYGPYVPTVATNSAANRWVGSSKYWISAFSDASNPTLSSLYTYAPSFSNYLGYLQAHTPTTSTSAGSKSGWYIDYSGNGGYSFYMSVTGTATTGYGIQIHDVHVNTGPSAANNWQADPNAGTTTSGTITVASNGSTVTYVQQINPTTSQTVATVGNWTDATIYSGASLINGDFASGPVIVSTGDFAADGAYNDIVASILASISASMATGLLGSDTYNAAYNASDPEAAFRQATMYFFNTLLREDALDVLFSSAWQNGEEYYDPYWALLAEYTDMQGYLSPFNDRWANFSPDFSLGTDDTITWELGITAVPEPAAASALLGLGALAFAASRRRARRA